MRTILSILSLFLCLTLSAQKLTIENFTEKSNDLTARTEPRKDNNGNACALVKVRLAAEGAQFEGNVIGTVSYSTSEYNVYMSGGSKRLTVKLSGYLPCEVTFAEHGTESLTSLTTYVLTITGVATVVSQPQAVRTKTGWIIIDSKPSGAAVYINDEFVGNTPLDSYKQPYGTYSYRVEKPNYHSASGTVELNAAQAERTITLKPAFGSISVSSNVNGATVLLDGKSTSKTTPCTLTEIPSGSHIIVLQKEKYAPMQYNVTVEDGLESRVNGNLSARFASVTINTLKGATILIDNERKGTSSITDDLMEGYYDVEVRLSHHKNATRQIQVVAGQPQTITINPVPIYGSLDIVSSPRSANITIDGKSYGQTPYTVEQLLEGEHMVTLSLEGYAKETRSVTISEGQTASVSAMLQMGCQITISTKEPGSTIYIDGREVGPSPYTGTLPFGTHTAYAMLNGKKTSEQRIVSSEGTGVLPSVVLSFFGSKTFTVKGVSFTMIPVEGGTFQMGATPEQKKPLDNEKPVHSVTLSSYYIGETEVTQALWEAVMGNNPSRFKGSSNPVENVSWNDCQEFISKLNSITGQRFRLPTEAEWEYAARGGNKSRGYKYSGRNNIFDVAWYGVNSRNKTHPVKTKQPNELGIYNMSGNVWEWCQDWFDDYSSSPQTNPTGASSGSDRVNRGGSWYDYARYCRVAYRSGITPGRRCDDLGLRLVL